MRKRKPLTRYIYLMERVTEREWSSILRGKREIKIGVAKNAEERLKQVDRGIKGKMILLDEFKVEKATTKEAKLHRDYKRFKFKPKGAKKGAGGTEFFKLSNKQLGEIKSSLIGYQNQRESSFFLLFLGLGSVIIILYHFLN